MSGGSMDYVCFRIEECADYVEDKEIKELVKDLAKLMHDLEWYQSADYSRDQYEKTLSEFKTKWFGDKRNERLKEYLNATLDDIRREISNLI